MAQGRTHVTIKKQPDTGGRECQTKAAWLVAAGKIMIALRRTWVALFAVPMLLAAVSQPARSEQPQPVPAKPQQAACERSAFRVALDVGHTVTVPGAISARGATEYSFNLRLGEATKQALVTAGFAQTDLLITKQAPPLGLFERAAIANRMRADLFIALHHDSVPDSMLQSWEYEGRPLHFNDNYPGYALFVSYDNPDRADSLMFGHLLGEALQARGLSYTPHYTLPLMGHRRRELVDDAAGVYRYDQLVVLRATHMPAVLFEAGSIVNRSEELALASSQRVALESEAVTAAVEDFCTARAARLAKHGPLRRPAARDRPAHSIRLAH